MPMRPQPMTPTLISFSSAPESVMERADRVRKEAADEAEDLLPSRREDDDDADDTTGGQMFSREELCEKRREVVLRRVESRVE